MFRNKKILITGGLGFIGSNLAIALVNKGARVTILDALLPNYGGNFFNIKPIEKEVDIQLTDLRSPSSLPYLVKDKEIIFNLAGTLSHVDSMSSPLIDLSINCEAQLNLLEAVRLYNPTVKIIFAGTRNQYGKAKFLPVTEEHPQEPTDINGIHSIAAEQYHLMYTKVYGIKTVSLRLTNTFGPRHQMRHSRQGVLNWFLRQLIDSEEITLFGNGQQIRDINYIDDVVNAFLVVASSKKGVGEAFNLGGTPLSLQQFVEMATTINHQGNFSLKAFPKDRETIEVGDYIASIEKIRKTFGFTPKTKIEAGIKKTLSFYKKNKQYYW